MPQGKENMTTIPVTMSPGTTLIYDEDLKPIVKIDVPPQKSNAIERDVLNEDQVKEFQASLKEIDNEAKNYKTTVIPYTLPTPTMGMTVMYGSDGQINHIYNSDGTEYGSINRAGALQYPSHAAAGTYNYGTSQVITIGTNTVKGTGRFTVFEGPGTVGSSGKTLVAGDVATKQSIDNWKHNTPITATANGITKTVYKNDIGDLPNAVLDLWKWSGVMFGYTYSNNLSMDGTYSYTF